MGWTARGEKAEKETGDRHKNRECDFTFGCGVGEARIRKQESKKRKNGM